MKVAFRTFGCQMNINDTEAMMGVLSAAGYGIASSEEEADAVIVNTCAVRGKSEDKLYGKLGQLKALKKRKGNLLVGVCGCVAEKNATELLTHKEVDFVFGTRAITRVDKLLKRAELGERFIEMGDFIDELDSDTPRVRTSSHHAWITIIFGCDKFCSYCIVPYTRGREKSREMGDILSEARELAGKGYREITYLGQNVDSYGKDLSDGSSLSELIRETTKIEGIERIWFLTSYPRDFSDELIDVIASSDKISRSIHLPVQSGSNRILKAMNRGYTREYYIDLIDRVKSGIPNVTLSTDLIIGFPGETEEEYEETVSLVKGVRFERINLAMYSPREGTLSARKMADDIPQEVKTRRLNHLLALQKHINREENEKYLDRIIDVIGEGRIKGNGKIYGRTMNNKIVIYEAQPELIGKSVKIRIERVSAGPLYGVLVR
ncbi:MULTISPECIES: tRNA (N6-isopentenyl adenosine(37)-C2)-methylthiotransferase MiaB [unclassified Mesotoga]|uniref:tRNA (N6-isopentenyl adenosine(37)-C2)-methylthiotransferase MiaB n=1 Tax=unclassified Mesotoga TaxID=1184398 RepID=UPI000DA6DA05|nr:MULTISPECIES: tRNA (N6-isopentenyl adenosine(37)-C2)-methylthiotransferase MiaB [unclassified Mesotoga]PZC53065.1 (dimethylallyl)adenosine tRNA methylthiotransferase [Mesotoga sp. TolDC]